MTQFFGAEIPAIPLVTLLKSTMLEFHMHAVPSKTRFFSNHQHMKYASRRDDPLILASAKSFQKLDADASKQILMLLASVQSKF